MNIIITGKNFTPSKANKEFVQKKLESLLRYNERLYQVRVELDADKKERNNTKFRVEIWVEGAVHLQAGSQGKDFYSSVEMTVRKLKTQLGKLKEKRESQKKAR